MLMGMAGLLLPRRRENENIEDVDYFIWGGIQGAIDKTGVGNYVGDTQADEQLYFETGVLEAGPVDGELVPGVLQSAAEHDLDVEHLTPHEAHARWPQYWIPEHYGVVFERRAGFLMVERCVQAHLDGAIQAGATIRTGVEVQGWQPFGSHPQQGYAVTVDGQLITADKLIITAGAWSPTLLPDIAGKFQILRKPLHWFAADENIYGTATGCPSLSLIHI